MLTQDLIVEFLRSKGVPVFNSMDIESFESKIAWELGARHNRIRFCMIALADGRCTIVKSSSYFDYNAKYFVLVPESEDSWKELERFVFGH